MNGLTFDGEASFELDEDTLREMDACAESWRLEHEARAALRYARQSLIADALEGLVLKGGDAR